MKKVLEVNGLCNRQKNVSLPKLIVLKAMMFVFVLFFSSASFSQHGKNWNRRGGWGMGSHYNGMYDVKTVETIVGEVISVEKIVPMKGMTPGVHLTVKTNKETVSVHLGPEWFINSQDASIIAKDKIEVKGSRITYEGKAAIVAAEVIKGNEVLLLRNSKGIPVWSGWRGR